MFCVCVWKVYVKGLYGVEGIMFWAEDLVVLDHTPATGVRYNRLF